MTDSLRREDIGYCDPFARLSPAAQRVLKRASKGACDIPAKVLAELDGDWIMVPAKVGNVQVCIDYQRSRAFRL